MSSFDLWLKGCEVNGTNVYPVAGTGQTALYKCWKDYISGNNVSHETPVYVGWVSGKEVCATTNYTEAAGVWKNAQALNRP